MTAVGSQATPLVAGLSVAVAAVAARSALEYYAVWRATPRLRKVFEGGFQPAMDKREAAHILGIRCVRGGATRSPAFWPAHLAASQGSRRRLTR